MMPYHRKNGISREEKRASKLSLQKAKAAKIEGRFSQDFSEDFSSLEKGATTDLMDLELLEGFINIGKEKIRQVIHF